MPVLNTFLSFVFSESQVPLLHEGYVGLEGPQSPFLSICPILLLIEPHLGLLLVAGRRVTRQVWSAQSWACEAALAPGFGL